MLSDHKSSPPRPSSEIVLWNPQFQQSIFSQLLTRDGVPLGNQKVQLITPGTAFRLTSLSDGAESYETHLRSLLDHSPLRAIQWVNLARHQIQFVTLSN